MFQSVKTFSLLFTLLLVIFTKQSFSIDQVKYVTGKATKKSFPLNTNREAAHLMVSDNDYSGVLRVVRHFQADIKNVTNIEPNLSLNKIENAKHYAIEC